MSDLHAAGAVMGGIDQGPPVESLGAYLMHGLAHPAQALARHRRAGPGGAGPLAELGWQAAQRHVAR